MLKLISLLIIFFTYFNRFPENDEKSEYKSPNHTNSDKSNSSYSSDTNSDESTSSYYSDASSDESISVSTDKIADENVEEPIAKSDSNERKLNFTIRSENELKRFLYVILVYILCNIING